MSQALGQQRIVRAGEHDGVGSPGAIAKARLDLGAQFYVACRPAAQFRFGVSGELFGTDEIRRRTLRVLAADGAASAPQRLVCWAPSYPSSANLIDPRGVSLRFTAFSAAMNFSLSLAFPPAALRPASTT
jgi:hypothetical protein